MITPLTPVCAKVIEKLEGCSPSTSFRRLQAIKEHYNITKVRIKHLAEYWLVDSQDIIVQLLPK
jgi:hypothetical protein